MNYNILDFIKEYHPLLLDEFRRYQRKDKLPAIGTVVTTLVNGYSGLAGVTRYVVGHDERYIHIAVVPDGQTRCLCEIKNWWKELKIVLEPKTVAEG
jgi:hypothetical protein